MRAGGLYFRPQSGIKASQETVENLKKKMKNNPFESKK